MLSLSGLLPLVTLGMLSAVVSVIACGNGFSSFCCAGYSIDGCCGSGCSGPKSASYIAAVIMAYREAICSAEKPGIATTGMATSLIKGSLKTSIVVVL